MYCHRIGGQFLTMKLCFMSAGAALWLAGCTPVGPTPSELSSALAEHPSGAEVSEVRRVRCHGFAEELTEFDCEWQQRGQSSDWQDWSAGLAIDGDGFHFIDGPAPKATSR